MAVQSPPDDDQALARQAKAGSLEAMETLVGRHETALYSTAMRILRNAHDAEDATQQALLDIVENLESFREESSFRTWAHRITTFAALKIIRKRRGLETVSLEASTEAQESYDQIPHPEFIADWRESPERLAQQRETARLIEEAMEQLEEKHRLVFLLRDIEGLSGEETAQALGISVANVKVRLLRARLRLRELLTRAFGNPARRQEPHRHPHEEAPAKNTRQDL